MLLFLTAPVRGAFGIWVVRKVYVDFVAVSEETGAWVVNLITFKYFLLFFVVCDCYGGVCG